MVWYGKRVRHSYLAIYVLSVGESECSLTTLLFFSIYVDDERYKKDEGMFVHVKNVIY